MDELMAQGDLDLQFLEGAKMQKKGMVTVALYFRTRDKNATNPQLHFYASLEGGRS